MSWETWSFAFNVTVPNLLMMLLGSCCAIGA